MTYLAFGLLSFKVNILKTSAIPVATGQTRHAFTDVTPENKVKHF